MKIHFKSLAVGTCFKAESRIPGATLMRIADDKEACIIAGPLVHRGKVLTFEPESMVETVMAQTALAQVSLAPTAVKQWATGDKHVVGDYGHVNKVTLFAGLYLSTGVSKGYYFSAGQSVLWCEEAVAEQIARDEHVPFVSWRTFHYATDEQLSALRNA